ncbi:1-phosphofructokinase family hexose kinase [Microbacterium esteraromaticum]|uniref:1-phosphofructokinase family hexose kinase n=1 Tax=Microbacterium esteraromaticum TaxID=57043 RepID=UPI0019D39CF0|nr:PfkB family carbohydrate kinase [Microbacterium esteraromaticum]MBN7793917.1 1-phosphofructokinase family hexose kinase [Microbacterium esteraromaticum]
MIVTVTANPALDLTWHVEKIVAGGTHRADAGAARAGGKGLNVARVAHAQGAAALAITTTGGATGAEFTAELEAAGVPHVLVPVTAATRRSIALVDEALGDTTIVNERGIAPTAAEWDALRDKVAMALAAGPAVLVISGSFPPATPDDVLPTLIGLGRAAGATVIVDTSGPSLLAAADAGASVLKPNEHELAEATGLDDPVDGARELLRRGAELVLLSRGADGMLAVTAASYERGADTPHVGRSPASGPASGVSAPGTYRAHPPVDILHARLGTALAGNPTGAGDAAVAACAVLMDAGIHDPAQILRRATAWSAAAVLMPLAGEIHPTWTELESALILTPKETR